jgi:hypothetical protein
MPPFHFPMREGRIVKRRPFLSNRDQGGIMVESIQIGDRVTIEGEEGIWDVNMTGEGFPVVRVILEGDPATWEVVHTKKLKLVSSAETIDGSQRHVSATNLFD